VHVALVGRQGRQPAAEEDHVHTDVVAGQRGEAVGGHLLSEAEVLLQEAAGRSGVLDVE
jgi:predicted DNA-binding protein with PD1-like motif